jgi:hypothetical protein
MAMTKAQERSVRLQLQAQQQERKQRQERLQAQFLVRSPLAQAAMVELVAAHQQPEVKGVLQRPTSQTMSPYSGGLVEHRLFLEIALDQTF